MFSDVYSSSLWGGDKKEFYSGSGSTAANAQPYIDYVTTFIGTHNVNSVVDIGCGDFRVSGALVEGAPREVSYLGIDVVPDLIAHNQERYANDHVQFILKQISSDDPAPAADLYLIREVLQHLSFTDIERLLAGCQSYKYLLITNTIALGATPKNADMRSGGQSRVALGSGLWPELPPIDLDATEVLSYEHLNGSSQLRTVLVKNAGS